MVGIVMGASLSLATGASVVVLRAPAQSLLPAEDGPNCTALILDRVTGLTAAAACRRSGAILLEASVRARPCVRT